MKRTRRRTARYSSAVIGSFLAGPVPLAFRLRCRPATRIFTLVTLVVIMLAISAGKVSAFGPGDALAYKSQEYAAAEAKFAAQRAQLHALNFGLSSSASASKHDQGEEYLLGITWSRSIVAITQAKQAEEAASRELIRLARESARQALCAHADLWEAQMVTTAADTRSAAAQLRREESERKGDLGAISALDVESARLDQADAKLAQRQAKLQLTNALDEARRFGLTGEAEAATMHFKIPVAKLDMLPDYRDAKWEALVAGARLKQNRRDNTPALGVNAYYQHLESTLEVDASSRNPSMTVNGHYQPLTLNLPGQYTQFLPTPGWQFIFQLDFPLNPAGQADIRVAKADLRVATARLAEKERELPVQLAKARAAVDTAVERLQLAHERTILDERRVASVLAQAKAGAVSKLAVLEAQASQSDNNAAYARAWKSYVTAVADYLGLAGGSWEVAP